MAGNPDGWQPPPQPEPTLEVGAAPSPVDGIDLPTVDPRHYERGREIARGGIGRIVEAVDRRLGRRVAIKELLQPGKFSVARFMREIGVTARLSHPGVVSLHEAGIWPD